MAQAGCRASRRRLPFTVSSTRPLSGHILGILQLFLYTLLRLLVVLVYPLEFYWGNE